MAALLYLPRLFAYHSEEQNNSKIIKILFNGKKTIKNYYDSAMISTWIFGFLFI